MTFASASDTKLAARAIRESWPMDAEQRTAAIDHLRAVAADARTRPQLRAISHKALAAAGVEIPVTQPPLEPSA